MNRDQQSQGGVAPYLNDQDALFIRGGFSVGAPGFTSSDFLDAIDQLTRTGVQRVDLPTARGGSGYGFVKFNQRHDYDRLVGAAFSLNGRRFTLEIKKRGACGQPAKPVAFAKAVSKAHSPPSTPLSSDLVATTATRSVLIVEKERQQDTFRSSTRRRGRRGRREGRRDQWQQRDDTFRVGLDSTPIATTTSVLPPQQGFLGQARNSSNNNSNNSSSKNNNNIAARLGYRANDREQESRQPQQQQQSYNKRCNDTKEPGECSSGSSSRHKRQKRSHSASSSRSRSRSRSVSEQSEQSVQSRGRSSSRDSRRSDRSRNSRRSDRSRNSRRSDRSRDSRRSDKSRDFEKASSERDTDSVKSLVSLQAYCVSPLGTSLPV